MRWFKMTALAFAWLTAAVSWPMGADALAAPARAEAAAPASTAHSDGCVTRALVLGGGGATGRAWEVGLLKGLRDLGVDLTEADLIIGTSAGSVLGTRLRAGQSLDTLYQAMLAPPSAPAVAPAHAVDAAYFQETMSLWAGRDTSPALRIEVGRRALAAPHVLSEEAAVQQRAATLGTEWPSRPLQITAVDVEDGTTRLIDRSQGVPLARAVAASTALPGLMAPVSIGDRRYMDGGVGGTHLDAAIGYGLVVGVTPSAGPTTAREIEQTRAAGSRVLNFAPDEAAREAPGADSRDPSRLAATAEAGLRQARAVSAELGPVWRDLPRCG
jgi:NTE family protein